LSARISGEHLGEVLAVDGAEPQQGRMVAPGDEVEMADQPAIAGS
jgi:hypothetical protein